MGRKKTHEEYVAEVAIKNPSVEVIGEYVDAKTKIMHHCLKHDVYWEAFSSNILKGKGCKECMKEKNRIRFTKSHDEYVEQVRDVNPYIVILEQYINKKTPILHLCTKHNIQWKAMPTNILKGCGCPECKREKIINYNLKTHEQYSEELSNKNPTVDVIDEYIDVTTPILHYCKIHNEYWKSRPDNVLHGKGCPKCRTEKIHNAQTMSHEEYVTKLSLKNPNIEAVEKYVDSRTKILHFCKIHNEYWKTSPYHVLNGAGCPKCRTQKIHIAQTKTQNQYIEELKSKNSNVVVLEQYIDMKTPIIHKCIKHNFEWTTTPNSVLQGCGCPKCRAEKLSNIMTKTQEEYELEVQQINPSISVIGNYIHSNVKILHKCKIDGCEWYMSPSNILQGGGCPQCHESKGERRIRQWLDSHMIQYEYQKKFEDCKDIKPLPFDFYLQEHNSCIEYDGKQHYTPIEYFGGQDGFEKTVKHDRMKDEYCKNNNIGLLRIPYFENIEDTLNNFIYSI